MTDYRHLIGRRFPGGTYTLPEYLSWLWADAVCAEPDPARAHPALAYFVAMQGCGVSIQEIFEMMGATADSGVMFGETSLQLSGTLTPGATYEVEGEILDVTRKQGKRAGVFDRLVFANRVRRQGESEPVAISTNTWIFPRKEES